MKNRFGILVAIGAAMLGSVATEAADFTASSDAELATAVGAATNPGDTITLTADISVSAQVELSNPGVTLRDDGNGRTLSGVDVAGNEVGGFTPLVHLNADGTGVQGLRIVHETVDPAPGLRSGVGVTANNTTIEGCFLTTAISGGNILGLGAHIDSGMENVTFRNCTFDDNLQGLNMQHSNVNFLIEDCTATAANRRGINLDGVATVRRCNLNAMPHTAGSASLWAETFVLMTPWTTGQLVIEDCVLSGEGDFGLLLNDVGETVVRNTLITTEATASVDARGTSIEFDHCTFFNEVGGGLRGQITQNGEILLTNSILKSTAAGSFGISDDNLTNITSNYNNAIADARYTNVDPGVNDISGSDDAPFVDEAAGDFRVEGTRLSAISDDMGGPLGSEGVLSFGPPSSVKSWALYP